MEKREEEHVNEWMITEILARCYHAVLACVRRYHLPWGTLLDIPSRYVFGI